MSIRRPDDDDLDRLLSQAEWPELQKPEAAEAVDRLSRAWRDLRRAEPARRSRRLWQNRILVGAVAAAVALVASVLMLRGLANREPVARVKSADVASSIPQPAERPSNPSPQDQATSDPPVEQFVREPNTYERMLLRTQARAAQAQVPVLATAATERDLATQIEARAASPDDLALDRLLSSRSPQAAARFLTLVAEPTSQKAALTALERAKSPPIDNLAAFLDDPRRPVRLAAAHALSTLDNPHAVERLSQSVAGIGRQEALMALLASRSPRASELVDAARHDVYLMASVRAAEQQLMTLQTENGENLP